MLSAFRAWGNKIDTFIFIETAQVLKMGPAEHITAAAIS